jgi:hypothetical protein
MPAPHVARQAFVVSLVAVLTVLLLGSPVSALSGVRSYDIPEQALVAALAEFADQAAMSALVDAEVARDKTSSRVKGKLLPHDALRILLAGTGLSFRRVNDIAFAVGPNTSEQVADGPSDNHSNGGYDGYFARVQDQTERSLCNYPRIGAGRGVVQVWIGPAGAIDAVHVVTRLDDERSAALSEQIMRTRVAPPPAGLPQPITMILRGNEWRHCADGPPTTP